MIPKSTNQPERVFSFPATPLLSANTVYYLAFNDNSCSGLRTTLTAAFSDGGAGGSFRRLYHIITMKIAGGNLITISKGDRVEVNIEIALKITKKNEERKEKTTISRYGLM